MSRQVLALAALVLCAGGVAPAHASSTTLFALDDSRLSELSGIAAGITSPRVFYVHNDSGDSARFFALDARDGVVRAELRVPDAQNHDWEDIAVAPDSRGVASVWLADIGDNDRERGEIQLYRVDEPRIDMTRRNVVSRTQAPEVWRLRYPNGPANAESLAVTPTGRPYIVTKAEGGRSVVYAVPVRAAPDRVQKLTRVGVFTVHAHASVVPARLQLLATGAAISADGAVFVVRTYTDAYAWAVHDGDLAAALGTPPVRVGLPLQPQGEGVCVWRGGLILDSETNSSPVLRVPLPVPSSEPSTRGPAPHPPAPASSPAPSTRPDAVRGSDHTAAAIVGATAVVLGACLVAAARRGRARG